MVNQPWWSRIGIQGFLTFLFYFLLKRVGVPGSKRLVPVKVKGFRRAFYARYGTSDPAVFKQIFMEKEYACLTDVHDPKLIIDCGANVGYSSIWFLNHYPSAQMIAVEPNDENFEMCKKNLESYGGRVLLTKAAVWPYETPLLVTEGKNGREWAFQVRECGEGEKSNLLGVEIGKLLKQSGFEAIDILKIDIEKAEKMLFSRAYEAWLSKVKNIVIELHDSECERIFFKAMAGRDYELSKSGELTVCKNISGAKPVARPRPAEKISRLVVHRNGHGKVHVPGRSGVTAADNMDAV